MWQIAQKCLLLLTVLKLMMQKNYMLTNYKQVTGHIACQVTTSFKKTFCESY